MAMKRRTVLILGIIVRGNATHPFNTTACRRKEGREKGQLPTFGEVTISTVFLGEEKIYWK